MLTGYCDLIDPWDMPALVRIPCTYLGAQKKALSYLLKHGFEFSCERRSATDFALTVHRFDAMAVRNEMGRAGLDPAEFTVEAPVQEMLSALATAADVLAHARHFYTGSHGQENFTIALQQIASAQRAAGVAPSEF